MTQDWGGFLILVYSRDDLQGVTVVTMAEGDPRGPHPITLPNNDTLALTNDTLALANNPLTLTDTLTNDTLANMTATTVATVVAEVVTEVEARVVEATTAMAAGVVDNLSASALPLVKNVTSFAESTFVQVSFCLPLFKLLIIYFSKISLTVNYSNYVRFLF